MYHKRLVSDKDVSILAIRTPKKVFDMINFFLMGMRITKLWMGCQSNFSHNIIKINSNNGYVFLSPIT